MDRRKFLGLIGAACTGAPLVSLTRAADQTLRETARPASARFEDATRDARLNFTNVFGAVSDKRYLLETTGCGAAWVDYDRDGNPDLFLVNGTTIEGFPSNEAPTNRLFHNNGNGTFTDVTIKAGMVHCGWGQGVCVGDYNNDGWDDIFVSYYGENLLYRNNGDGTFAQVARQAGVAGDPWRWNTGCAFLDYDRDGYLDLFVANYVDQGKDFRLLPQPGSGQFCDYKGIPMACGPRGLRTGRNFLYHNNRDGTFTDVSKESGIILLPDNHYALGVLTVDYDNDGWPDIYVACDSTASILYHNNHNGTFTDLAFMAGVAYSGDGEAQAGMGVASADYDEDGYLDIAKTNFSDDTPDLYHNNRDGTFSDVTFAAGLGTHPNYMGWGVGFLDYDNDGWPDLFMANGFLDAKIDRYHIDSTYAEPKLLYRNVAGPDGMRVFQDFSKSAGPGIQLLSSARGVALGDYDNDGAIDIVINNMNGPAYLLRNDGDNRSHWIKIKTLGVQSNRSGVGARVEIRTGTRRQIDEVRSGGSYLSQNDMRVHFGLGDHLIVDEIVLRWPSGQVDGVRRVPADRIITIQEGKGMIGG